MANSSTNDTTPVGYIPMAYLGRLICHCEAPADSVNAHQYGDAWMIDFKCIAGHKHKLQLSFADTTGTPLEIIRLLQAKIDRFGYEAKQKESASGYANSLANMGKAVGNLGKAFGSLLNDPNFLTDTTTGEKINSPSGDPHLAGKAPRVKEVEPERDIRVENSVSENIKTRKRRIVI